MPTGHVKVFNPERNFGFLVSDEGADLFVHADAVEGGTLRPGDEVEYELAERDVGGRAAAGVRVVKQAPPQSPAGRTLAQPPMWDDLEARDRERRQNRRRRR